MTKEIYPILKIPQELLNIAVAKPEDESPVPNLQQISQPTPPIKPRTAKPVEPGFNTLFPQVAIALLISVSWAFSVRTGAGVIFVIAVMVVSYIFYKQKQDYGIQKAKFDQTTLNYMAEKEAYEQELERWQKSLATNQISIRERQNNFTDQANKIKIALQNFQKIRSLKPIPGSNAPIGRGEKDFYQILNHFYPGQILIGYKVVKYIEYPYTPDLICYFEDWNLYIDIEVDEPYTCIGKTRKPTHCTDDCTDFNRDAFFIEKNWVVIRFAEEQIIKHPLSCCKFIAETISLLIGEPIPQKLKKVDDLITVPRWNTRKARKLSRLKHRGSY